MFRTHVCKSLPNTNPPATGAPEPVGRIGPRNRLPSLGPCDEPKASESDTDEDVTEDDMLHDPEGALGVRRCLPFPRCACVLGRCDDEDWLEDVRPSLLSGNEPGPSFPADEACALPP